MSIYTQMTHQQIIILHMFHYSNIHTHQKIIIHNHTYQMTMIMHIIKSTHLQYILFVNN